MSERVPDFNLNALDAQALMRILERYGPYNNGQTALYWHLVGVIAQHREVSQRIGEKEP